jgi:uncharacterized protein (TIGR00369 family)
MNQTKQVPTGYELIQNTGFNAWIGPILGKFSSSQTGPHHFILDLRDEHLNGGGMMHGGLMMAMADSVLGTTVRRAAGALGSTISLNCDFLAGAGPGERIQAEAVISRMTRSIAFVNGRLYTDEKTLLTASGIWKIRKTGGPQ